ncbi:MAG: DUF86 domain-containing protein [Candidatus Atribacteria bacterium]|nr:DUF86 domain-containing protein [Candidatus Atribacteria bacterium]
MEKETLLERFKRLEENIKELSSFREKVSFEEIYADKTLEWALRYGLLETIQSAIDLACHLVSRDNLGNPSTYAECITILEKNGYIDTILARRLTGMVGLRNLLIHEYATIDLKELYQCLFEIEDFTVFAQKIAPHLK